MEWRDVDGWPYSVNSDGFIMSNKTGKVLEGYVNKHSPYLQVCLCGGGCQATFNVHNIVAQAFLGQRPPGTVINHINGDKLDNRAENLEYVTFLQNCDPVRGSKHVRAKLTEELVTEIRQRYVDGESVKLMAEEYGVGQATLHDAATGKTWRHVPFPGQA